MGRVALSIDDQIKRLEEKGLDLSCYEPSKLKEILLDIGYYRLGFYTYYFMDDEKENFLNGIKISEIIELYYMDIDLKYILMKYINRIEINFRTKLIYYPSIINKQDPFWFVDEALMKKDFVEDFKKRYDDNFKRDNLMLKKHHINHPADIYAPAWKTFEYLSFGSIITLFDAIKDLEIKNRISKLYQVNDLGKFMRLIHAVRQIRNICAHSNVLFDFSLPQSLSSHPKINYNKGDRNSLDASLKVIAFFLESISINRLAEFKSEIYSFFEKHKVKPHLLEIIRNHIKYLD